MSVFNFRCLVCDTVITGDFDDTSGEVMEKHLDNKCHKPYVENEETYVGKCDICQKNVYEPFDDICIYCAREQFP